ncbi:MAG: SAM-dependent methyltransferase, partial [Pseudomonadota bacterium]|nr:SAM-dependent methyltransferase [Pseudomonadota bacterium]
MESIALKSKWLIKGAQSPPLLAIALLSAAALGYQVLLLRLFSIIQWHHFAYMIISLALLGYGASGTFLALLPPKMKRGFSGLFAVNTILFSFAAILCFLWAQHIQFNPLELFWTPGYQAIRLMGIY